MLMHCAVKNAANLSDFYTFSIIELNGKKIRTCTSIDFCTYLLDWVACEVRPIVPSACKDNKFVEV